MAQCFAKIIVGRYLDNKRDKWVFYGVLDYLEYLFSDFDFEKFR